MQGWESGSKPETHGARTVAGLYAETPLINNSFDSHIVWGAKRVHSFLSGNKIHGILLWGTIFPMLHNDK